MRQTAKTITSKLLGKLLTLPPLFPNRPFWSDTLSEFSQCGSYWYIPKGFTLSEENVPKIKARLKILEQYNEQIWNIEIEKQYFKQLHDQNLIDPYSDYKKQKEVDYTALVRIIKIVFEELGLAWTNPAINITKAGEMLISADSKAEPDIITAQVLKFQFTDININPSVFLSQLLPKIDFSISKIEWVAFLNMAREMDDVTTCAERISKWRHLLGDDRDTLQKFIAEIPQLKVSDPDLFKSVKVSQTPRYVTIERNYSYQKAFITFPFRNLMKMEEE